MLKRILSLLFLLGVAGCRDSADILSRDYRNLNNEAIDALMMITDEDRAKVMVERVIKEYPKRLQVIVDRAAKWKQNSEKDDYATQIYTSDSVAILIMECAMNKERLHLETTRLRRLRDQLAAEEREIRKQAGNPNPVDLKGTFPNLSLLLDTEGDLKKIDDTLEKGGDVIRILDEVNKDDRLQKSKKISDLKTAFETKVNEFKQSRKLTLRQN